MHSIWQEQMEFPVYPILKRDKKTGGINPCVQTVRNHTTFPQRSPIHPANRISETLMRSY